MNVGRGLSPSCTMRVSSGLIPVTREPPAWRAARTARRTPQSCCLGSIEAGVNTQFHRVPLPERPGSVCLPF